MSVLQDISVAVGKTSLTPAKPQLRPQSVISGETRPAIQTAPRLGTQNIEPIAVDARWSNYGQYLQRMINAVQIQWERTVIEQKANPASGSSVTVKLVINDEGRVVDVRVMETTANEAATRACSSAITERMPYGPWSDEMKSQLGAKQEMTFTFNYK
jgi:hypothetical protein